MDKNAELMESLKNLRLQAFIDCLEEVESSNLSLRQSLLTLCRHEWQRRHDLSINRRLKQAGFPKIKTLTMIDYNLSPGLSKEQVNNLSTCKFIQDKKNVILVGDSGGGKTHLAISLGVEACKQGMTVGFYDVNKLSNLLLKEHKYGDIERIITKLKKLDLLILDELGYVPFSKNSAELLFRVFSERYEVGSLIITTNLHFSKWTNLFQDKTMTTALLDRVTHNATIIKYDWGSIRLTETLGDNKQEEIEEAQEEISF
jgi:DNA replication protein DnaC